MIRVQAIENKAEIYFYDKNEFFVIKVDCFILSQLLRY